MLTPALTCCALPHAFCLSCVLEVMQTTQYGDAKGRCPLCRTQISKSSLIALKLETPADASEEEGAMEDEEGIDESHLYSSKLDALVFALQETTDEHPKTVVFTHFAATQVKLMGWARSSAHALGVVSSRTHVLVCLAEARGRSPLQGRHPIRRDWVGIVSGGSSQGCPLIHVRPRGDGIRARDQDRGRRPDSNVRLPPHPPRARHQAC